MLSHVHRTIDNPRGLFGSDRLQLWVDAIRRRTSDGHALALKGDEWRSGIEAKPPGAKTAPSDAAACLSDFRLFQPFHELAARSSRGALSRGLARSRRIARVEVNRRIRTSRLRPLRPPEKGSGWLAAERVSRSSASSSITLRTLRRIRLVNTPIRIHLIRLNGVRPQGFSRVWSTVYSAAPARERFHVR
jgi:hypothetical protein